MAYVFISEKMQLVNSLSNLGTLIEVDEVTLARWNKTIGDWWKVQLEMDEYAKKANQRSNDDQFLC